MLKINSVNRAYCLDIKNLLTLLKGSIIKNEKMIFDLKNEKSRSCRLKTINKLRKQVREYEIRYAFAYSEWCLVDPLIRRRLEKNKEKFLFEEINLDRAA